MFNFLTYNKFKCKKWEQLSVSSRIAVFQKMEDIMAAKQDREPFLIQPKLFNDGTVGLCVQNKRIIYLHEHYFTKRNVQFLGLATLFHEQRHIYQYNEVMKNEKHSKFSKAYKWQQNMEGYIDGTQKKEYAYYSLQDIERDANKFAIKQLRKFRFRFRFDEIYLRTLRQKEYEFDDTVRKARKELGLFYRFRLYRRLKKQRNRQR